MAKKKWTMEQLEVSLKTNVKEYGEAIAVGALFKKLYGRYPKIGLSGAQASYIDAVEIVLPDPVE